VVLRLLPTGRPRDVDLEELGHGRRVLSRLSSSLGEAVPEHLDLLVGGAHGDHAVRVATGALGVEWAGGRDVDRDGLLWSGVELRRLEGEMLALVPDDIPAEELVDDLDGLEQYRAADPDLRPVAADHVLVECLSSSESQPEAPGVHGAQRRGGMGYHCGWVSESGA